MNVITDVLSLVKTSNGMPVRTAGDITGSGSGEPGGAIAATRLVLVDVVDDEPDWQENALCAQTDPEAFFPEKGGSTREAKRICAGCEVRAECLEYALSNDERFGIWGGLSERERSACAAPAI